MADLIGVDVGKRNCSTCGKPINRGPGQHVYCSEECRSQCSAPQCSRPVRGSGPYCAAHRVQSRRIGTVKPPAWATEWVCVVCGAAVPKGLGRRKHCSGRCQTIDSRAPDRPKSFDCVKCGQIVDITVPSTKTGQFKRSDSKLCDKCKRRTRSNVTVGQLARRDGADCGICGLPVDLDAASTDGFRPSIDHIIPRAHGGTNDPKNLQLAHLWCNQVKHTRLEYKLPDDI